VKKLVVLALAGLSFQDSGQDLSKEFKIAGLEEAEKKMEVHWSRDGKAAWAKIWTKAGRQVIVFKGVRSPEYDQIEWADTSEPMSMPVYVARRGNENPWLVVGDKATRLKESSMSVRYDVAAKKAGFGVIREKDIRWFVQDIP
jgi:hypothetical protein